MPTIQFPDGKQRVFDKALTVTEIAQSISPSLAKSALAGKVNHQLVDTSFTIKQDSDLKIITDQDSEGLEIIRHSTAHLLAYAVKELFPSAQVTIGPVIEDGFYYDFAYERPFTPEDLIKIEEKMKVLAQKNEPVIRKTISRNEAITYFQSIHEHYKAEIIASIPENETLSLYSEGNFTDLCRGPHVPATGKLKIFKLMKVAGAYWRGDSKNEMLQRIYGTAWTSKEDLDNYLYRLEEAEKRDHRKLGKQLDFFHLQENNPGMVFWHPQGWQLWQIIEQYMRGKFRQYHYQEVRTPTLMDRSLWEKSGHWENYRSNMFITHSENRDYAIKPMNCPGHVAIFNHGLHSYRELPIRYSEFGSCHRNESSGSLHGLLRVRGFTQDDAHIFCTEQQIESEVTNFIAMLYEVYHDFGFHDVIIKLSTRPKERIGTDEIWDKAEEALTLALNKQQLSFDIQPGEGAFYGPKIEFTLKDNLSRFWQVGTIQLDFNLPHRLGAEYIAEDNQRYHPVMLHRAILGSMERFIGILIEHYAGSLPVWLSPTQVVVLGITDTHAKYVQNLTDTLKKSNLRTINDLRNEKINYKIREHTLKKVPFLLIIGDQEMANKTISVRNRKGENLGEMSLEVFIDMITSLINSKELRST